MITYAVLKAEVLGRLEIDVTDATRFKVDESLAHAQRAILNSLPEQHIANAIRTSRFDLVANTASYQHPEDYLRFTDLWLDYEAEITTTNLGRYATPLESSTGFIRNPADKATKRYPYVDLEVEGGISIYPVPAVDQTNGGRIRYIQLLPAPTDIQNCLLNERLQNLLVYKATAMSALVEEFNLNLAKVMNELFDKELAEFVPRKDKRQ